MAVWSEIEASKAFSTSRLDAEFFQPRYVEIEHRLSDAGAVRLEQFLTDIRYGLNVPPDYVDKGLPFIRALNLKEYGIEGEVLNIPYTAEDVGKINILADGDLLVVRSGANVGDVGIVTEDLRGGSFGSYVIRLRVKNINPYYLYVFLKCIFGREQTVRFRSGAAQPNISIPNLKELMICAPLDDQQEEIEKLFFLSYRAKQKASEIYSEAENLLLHELELDTLDLSHELAYERNFSEAATAGRFDAQYFAPRYQRAMKLMARSGQTLGSVAPLAKRFFHPVSDEQFNYIEIGNLVGNGQAESEVVMGVDAPSRAQWVVEAGDVITSTVRPIRRLTALIEPEQHGFVCSSGFAVLEPRNIASELLTVYLRLPIVSEVLDLHTTATMYPAIATEVLMNIPISQPSESTTIEIVNKVQQSRQAREQAKQLLNDAKRRVEQMINQ